jgi:hypothetical protein|eukprot:4516890-Prymnesium_polylepis.1
MGHTLKRRGKTAQETAHPVGVGKMDSDALARLQETRVCQNDAVASFNGEMLLVGLQVSFHRGLKSDKYLLI